MGKWTLRQVWDDAPGQQLFDPIDELQSNASEKEQALRISIMIPPDTRICGNKC
jgi:hypothetical protein